MILDKLILSTHSTFEDVFWRAGFLMPISFFRILFDEQIPEVHHFHYHVHPNNTFVVHLDTDTQRWERFMKFHENIVSNNSRISTTDYRVPHHQQLLPQGSYPNLDALLEQKSYGEAGVFASHRRIYENIVQHQDSNLSYAFILEDDGYMTPLLRRTKQVLAPDPVDMIFLTPNVIRAMKQKKGLTRVIGGAGSYGYIITFRGAQKLLSFLKTTTSCGWFDIFHNCHCDPLDIAFMKFAARHGFQIYLPMEGWPLVHHSIATKSSKEMRGNVNQ